MAEQRQTLTVEEVATILGVSRNSAYEAVKRGEIPALRRAGSRGITRTEIRDLFSRNRKQSQVDRVLSVLAEHGLAYSDIENTGGRPVERWFAANA